MEVGGALAADEHCAHLVEEAILVEEEAGAARVEEAGAARVERQQTWQRKRQTWLTRDRDDTTTAGSKKVPPGPPLGSQGSASTPTKRFPVTTL